MTKIKNVIKMVENAELSELFSKLVKCNSKYNLGVPPALFLRLEALIGLNESEDDE